MVLWRSGSFEGLCNLVRKSLAVPPSGFAVEDLGRRRCRRFGGELHWTCRSRQDLELISAPYKFE